MGLLKVIIAIVAIGLMEIITDCQDENKRQCFEIATSILFAGWIIQDGW